MQAAGCKTDSDLSCRGSVTASALLCVRELHRQMAELESGPEYDRVAALYDEIRAKYWNGEFTSADLAVLGVAPPPRKPRTRQKPARRMSVAIRATQPKPSRVIDDHLQPLIAVPEPENDFWTWPYASTLVDVRPARVHAEMKHPPRRASEQAAA